MKKLLLIVLTLVTFFVIAEDDTNATKESNTTVISTTNEINTSAVTTTSIIQKANISTIYLAMFNRVPDKAGLDYWEKKINDENWTIIDVSNSFFDQNETKELYPELYKDSVDSVKLITNIYQNLFNRYPDGDGLAYWDRQISAQLISPNLFILSIVNGAIGKDIEFLASAEKISKDLSSKNILVPEDFRDVLNILSDGNEELAFNYINYIANEPAVKRVRPTVTIDGNVTKDQVQIKVSSSSSLIFGLNVSIFNKPMDRWDMSNNKISSASDIIEMVISSDIYSGEELKVRLQDESENITSGVTTITVKVSKTPLYTLDSDGDGVLDRGDMFPHDANESRDTDGDGVGDNADECNSTPKDTVISANGCPPDTKATFSGDLTGTIHRGDNPVTGQITVTDPNDGEAGMNPKTLTGIYGLLVVEESGKWTYSLTTANLTSGLIYTDKFNLASKGGDYVGLTMIINGSVADTNSTTP